MTDKATTDPSLMDRTRDLEPHMDRNAELVDSALAQRQYNLVRRLFPGEVDQVVRCHEVAEIKTGFEYRRRVLQMAVETKLQAVEELCNHVLTTGKSEIRRQRQEFFAEQTLKLQYSMDTYAEQFNQQLERRFQSLANLTNPVLRQKEEERLLRTVDRFHDTLQQLADEFVAIINEGVTR